MLSGFLITTLLLREWESEGTIDRAAFYARRTLRIFPAYYACVAASFVIDRVAGHPWPTALTNSALGYAVNYYNAFTGHPSTSIAHLWSLGVEEQFYLLRPALFLVLIRRGLPALRAGLVAIMAGSIGWRVVLHYGFGFTQSYLYNAFEARFDNLAAGCLLATLVRAPHSAATAQRLGCRVWMPLVTLALMLYVDSMPSLPRHLFGFTVYSALVAVLIVQLLELHQRPLWRWLESPGVRFLGTLSLSNLSLSPMGARPWPVADNGTSVWAVPCWYDIHDRWRDGFVLHRRAAIPRAQAALHGRKDQKDVNGSRSGRWPSGRGGSCRLRNGEHLNRPNRNWQSSPSTCTDFRAAA